MATMTTESDLGLRGRLMRRYDGSAVQELFRRLGEMQFVNTITVFGATFLLTTLPFIVLMSSFASRRVDDNLAHHLGLNSTAAKIVEDQFHPSSHHSMLAIVIALLLGLAGTIGVAGSVQTIYLQIFARHHHGVAANLLRLLVWLAGLTGWIILDATISSALDGHTAAPFINAVAVLVTTTALIWWSMHLLLCGEVPWRELFLPAVVTAVFWIGLQRFAALYFSSTITTDMRLYGNIGVVFSLLTWFIAVAAVVVLGALAGDIWQRRRAERSGSTHAEAVTADAQ